jgi:hypothetical protein
VIFTMLGSPDLNNLGHTAAIVAGVTWSLSYEWFFYLTLPVIAGCAGMRIPLRYLAIGLMASISLYFWGPKIWHLFAFLSGMLSALMYKAKFAQIHGPRWYSSIFIISSLSLICCFSDTAYTVIPLLVMAICFLMLASGNTIFGILSNSTSVFLGEMAYSIYLLHGLVLFSLFNFVFAPSVSQQFEPTQHWLLVATATPLLILLSYLSCTFIEKPGIKSSVKLTEWARNHLNKMQTVPRKSGSFACNQVYQTIMVFVAAIVLQILAYDTQINLYDEGIILSGADAVSRGMLPYKDFWSMYGPGQFYLLSWLFSWIGETDVALRVIGITAKAVAASLCLVLIQRLVGKRSAWVGAALVLCVLIGFRLDAFPVFPALALSVAAILFGELGLRRGSIHYFFAGICTGIAACFRHDIGAYGMAALILAIVAMNKGPKQRASALVIQLSVYALGIASVVLPVAAYFLAHVPLADIKENLLTIPSNIYPSVRKLPWPSLTIHRPGELILLSVYAPFIITSSALLISFPELKLLSKEGRSDTFRDPSQWFLWLALSFTCLFFTFKGMVRVSPIHMSQSLVLVVPMMMATWHFSNKTKGFIQKYARFAVLLCALLMSFSIFSGAKEVTSGTWSLLTKKDNLVHKCLEPQLKRASCAKIDADYAAAANFLIAHTTPQEPIYIGTSRHDRIIMNAVALYFLTDRPPATKWAELHPGIQTQERIQSKMIHEFEELRPRYIVLDSRWESVVEPNASADSSGNTMLDNYINKQYSEVKTYGTVRIFLRVSQPV